MERFRKLKSLGRGQSGEVWLVEREDASLAALKQVYIENENSLNQEVSLLERLSHPHIIQYHESFRFQEYLFIVIDFAEGGDLANRIKLAKNKGYKFSEPQIWKWFMQICQGLEFIHANKIIHRDLKAQNIFLSKSGDIKIGDFGISRILSNSSELASTSVGTPYYIAPEVCKGQPYNYKADVWSLGCILYELCTLKHPFEGENLASVITSILSKSPEPLSTQYSEGLTNTVLEMLNKDAGLRPSISSLLSKMNLIKVRKSYQKEISINIPTPTNGPNTKINVCPFGTPQTAEKPPIVGALTNRSNSYFVFNESLLKQCPSSPIRPMLMGEFLKKKLGDEVFERIKRVVANSKDPVKLLRDEPWIFSSICGEESLSIIDVAISCGAFNMKEKSVFQNSTKNTNIRCKPFAGLSRHTSQ